MKKRVAVFGTFDIFHKGHESYLKQASKEGSVWAVVARNQTVRRIKGKLPKNGEKKRLAEVAKSGFCQKVLLGGKGDPFLILKKIKPDVICLGYDQKVSASLIRKKILEFGLENVKIKRLKAYLPRIYKSSKLSIARKK